MKIGPTFIEDTFAEAFRMRYVRLVVTAHDEHWVDAAAREVSGYGSSIISCDAEAAIERRLDAAETPTAARERRCSSSASPRTGWRRPFRIAPGSA